MAWKDIESFISKKFEEYKGELKDATSRQEHQKKFNEWYTSDEKKRELALKALLPEEKKAQAATNGSVGSPGSYSGTVQEQFWQFFIADGYSKAAVAGMMGNIERETGGAWQATVVEGGFTEYSGGIGLVQWTGGRNTNLRNFASEQGKDWSDLSVQLAFLKHELDTETWFGFTGGIAGFKKMTDVYAATAEFCWKFERPRADAAAMDVRNAAANKYYNQFKDATFSAGSSGGSSGLVRPCTGGSVSSEYGPRTLNGYADNHLGIDVATTGDALAAASGSVLSATWHDSYGNYIVIDHGTIDGKNIKTLYAHLSSMSVSAGNAVKQGQKIGVLGTTGNSFGVHLHFEVKVNDARTNPRNYVTF